MITIAPVRPEDKALLFSINQKYLYEMTAFYPDDMDVHGNYHYGHFEEYFTDPRRRAFFFCDGAVMVGFAMVHPYSVLGRTPDHTMAEFTVFPSYRRRGYALDAARQLLTANRGEWEIKYNEKNAAGKALWAKVSAPYAPTVHHLNDVETVLSFTV